MNVIQHNYPSLIQCLRAFHILIFDKLLLLLLLSQLLPNYYWYRYCYYCYCYCRYQFTILLCYWSLRCEYLVPSCGWIDNSTLILANILWPPPCVKSINLSEILPLKTVAIPSTCALSRHFSGAVPGEHSFICWVTWELYLLITMKNLKDTRSKIIPCKTSGGKELPWWRDGNDVSEERSWVMRRKNERENYFF